MSDRHVIVAVLVMAAIATTIYSIDDAIHTTQIDAQVSITKLAREEECTSILDADGMYSGDICTDTYRMYLDSTIPKQSISQREFDLLREGDLLTIHYRLGKHDGVHNFTFERV